MFEILRSAIILEDHFNIFITHADAFATSLKPKPGPEVIVLLIKLDSQEPGKIKSD